MITTTPRVDNVAEFRTALSEARARTLRTVDGKTIAGRTVVDGLLHRTLRQLLKTRVEEQRAERIVVSSHCGWPP